MTVYQSSILIAFLAIFITYSLGRLLFTVNFLLSFFLYSPSETVLDFYQITGFTFFLSSSGDRCPLIRSPIDPFAYN